MKQRKEMFEGDELAINVWKSKYAMDGEEHYDEMHKRMAKEFARVEYKYQAGIKENKKDKDLSIYGQERYYLTEESIFNLFKDFKHIVPQGSIMSTLGTPLIASLSNCLQGDTQVLTRQGFKAIKTLVDKNVEILTKGGSWVEAPFRSFGEQKLVELTLTRGKTDKKVIKCTEDHDWFKDNHRNPIKLSTKDLKVGDKLHSQYSKGWKSIKPSFFGISHGIVYGDGSTSKNKNFYSNIALCAESRVLGKYFPDSYISTDEELCEGGSDYYGRLPNNFKEAPNMDENKSYLLGWIMGYFAADGNIHKGSMRISSTDIKSLQVFKDVCGILGIHAGEIKMQTRVSNLTHKDSDLYCVHFSSYFIDESFCLLEKHRKAFDKNTRKPSRWEVQSIKYLDEAEEVFCGVVDGTHSFTIEGNILSGNCWVEASPLDSYSGIMHTDANLAFYYKRRGGVGTDLSNLRPKGTGTNNTAKTSTGMASFMHRFSNTTREVAMNGRRGALMLSCDINHPDIMDFIKIKRDGTSVTGANISVKLNNEFMEAVEKDEDYILRFPCDAPIPPDVSYLKYEELTTLKGQDNIYLKKIKAKEYWNEIVHSAKNYAEPGLMYWDNIIDYDPAAVYEQYTPTSSNPCGEQFLNPNDSCRLMALNLFSFVDNPFTEKAVLNIEKLYKYSYEFARLGDDLIDLELEYIQRIIDKIKSDPEPDYIKRPELELWEKSYNNTKSGRRVGLGITALADMLAALRVKYDSDEGLGIIDRAMKTKMEGELDCTIDLAILRGSFEGWNKDAEFNTIYHATRKDYNSLTKDDSGANKFYDMLLDEFPEQASKMYKYGRRNVSWSTIAPTGSVSILTQTSSGCEPLFMSFYMRRKKVNPGEDVRVDFVDEIGDSWQEFAVLHEKFKDWINSRVDLLYNINDENPEITVEQLSKEELEYLFELSPWYGSTANDIDWIRRNEIQAILQKYTTNAISSTINLPSTVTEQEVSDIYTSGWKLGLKGQTVYVDGSRSGVLVDSSKPKQIGFNYTDAVKRPNDLEADAHKSVSNGVPYNVIVGLLDEKPYEIFISEFNPDLSGKGVVFKKSKGNYFFKKNDITTNITSNMSEEQAAICRFASLSLRHGADIKYVVEQLRKEDGVIFGFTKSLARVLKTYIKDGEKSTVTCTECGSDEVVFEEGCSKCLACGTSACS